MSSTALRLVFAGTPEFAAAHLEQLLLSEHDVVAVYTQPDRPAGRGKKLSASPVKQVAQAADLPVLQPQSLRGEAEQAELAALAADVLIVVAYGLILPQAILDTPRLGCLNVHASLLPRWRGAAPIQRAIEAGDEESGVTIMQMDAGLDTGDMLAHGRCAIGKDTTASSLHDELASLGAPLLLQVLSDLPAAQANAKTQDDQQANYAAKIDKAEAQIDWSRPAVELDRTIRAFNPFPICFTQLNGQRLKIHQAEEVGAGASGKPPGTIIQADRQSLLVQCGSGQLKLQTLQLPGGKAMPVEQLLNGTDLLQTGVVLG